MTEDPGTPQRQVRAEFTDEAVRVYQAYSPEIAEPALAAGTFVSPFRPGRMTWIKPSFLWMMYRSGWGSKPGQERVLAVDITREGLEWALEHAALSSFERGTYGSHEEWAERKKRSPVRVQWDPERSLTQTLAPLPYRSLQVGLSGEAARRYVDEWILGITDVTDVAHQIHDLVTVGDTAAASALLPSEQPYEVPEHIRCHVGM
ncbi:MAG: DUF4291 domain-containing protein [Streptosporangiales bacterium]|nr:DUF4291 domain-containing protein [Streptosporangiales bacterium]